MNPRVAAALLAGALPMAALAQVKRTDDYLSKMDADRDGRVSLLEYQDWLSYGFDADENSVGFQTLPPFNHLGEKLEWRLSNALGRWFPIATIVRYHTAHPETGEDFGQVLVVSQIAEGNSCHIAYVDALANENANELARQAADKAGDFDCATDEVEIIGAFEAY